MVGGVRTDNDTWDITSSVGATALFVAAARALEAQQDEPLAVDPYAELFCRAAGGPWADMIKGKGPDDRLKSEFGKVFQRYQGARTRFFDNYFRAATDAGVRQIVIVAAGLDSRAYRLPWPDSTIVFELDQPGVLEFKRKALADHGDAPIAQRREVAVDLREDWPKALRDSGFDPSAPSAWLAEGLLIYLPPTAREQLFAGVDSLSASGSHVALEDMNPLDAETVEAKRAEERANADRASQFFSLIYNEEYRGAVAWFGERGWDAETTLAADYYQQLGCALPSPDSDGGQMLYSGSLVTAKK
jgi:methyltransferase (TIGR00027 family)